MIEIGVFGTIAAATLAWAVAECCRLLGRGLALARGLWTAGAALLVIHSTIAFAVFYRGSHAVALAETARQTKALTGIDSGLGLYVNIAFAAIWIADR